MIFVADYNPKWPQMFKEEKTLLSSAIGKWTVVIKHVGSTSVEGLGAKPIIDMVACVEELKTADDFCISNLEDAGYEYLPQFEKLIPERRFFRKYAEDGSTTHQIHLVEESSDVYNKLILFRNFLRGHPEVAKAYEKEKRRLAPMFTDTTKYAQAKSEFVSKALEEAEIWMNGFSTE
jgi:GrpB-like predicted nucleotidyltransferase (UPF0157 family)